LSNRDWSLVFFTTLAQWSVGLILCFTWLLFFSPEASPVFETGMRVRNPAVLALIFIGSATLSSFLHLGNPANAPKALNNLSGSWLSREILAIGIFSASLVIVLMLGWTGGNPGVLKYPMLISSLCGLTLLWMMIRIYVMPTIPAWNSWYTPVSFMTTAICLGLLACLAMQLAGWVDISGPVALDFTFALTVTLLIEIASAISHQLKLIKLDPGMDALVFDRGVFYRVFLFRMALLIIACLAWMTLNHFPELLPIDKLPIYLYPLFGLTIAQELIGRLLFYSSYFRIGV
jgi:anaerobic dimethyl sulfoxide reductase subunit C (anchor subunit)